jgi:hypothetical protein
MVIVDTQSSFSEIFVLSVSLVAKVPDDIL